MPVYSGDDFAEGERLLLPLRRFGHPVVDTIGAMTYSEASSMMDESAPAGRRYYWRSGFVPELDNGIIDVLTEGFSRVPSPKSMLLIDYMHGAATRPAPTATAFPHRSVGFNLILSSGWEEPADDEPNVTWADEVWRPVHPHSTGIYVNTLGSDGQQFIRDAYGPNYDRLARIKAHYDPENFFRMNQNIEPAA